MARLLPAGRVAPGSWGPVRGLLLRPWLLAGGVSFGLALGTKWEVAYPLAAFGLLVWVWSAGARRSFGVRRALLRSAVVDGVPAFLQLVVVALWSTSRRGPAGCCTRRSTRPTCPPRSTPTPTAAEDWPTRTEPDAPAASASSPSRCARWPATTATSTSSTPSSSTAATHTYASNPAGWLLLNRPVGVAADTDIQPGRQGCDAPAGSTACARCSCSATR